MAVRRILTLIACGAITTPALASPHSDSTNGRAVFTGATVAHPTSIVLNPAALGVGSSASFELYVSALASLTQVSIDRRLLDLSTGALSDGPSVDDLQLAPGGLISGIGHPNDRLALGVEFRVPPGEQAPSNHEELGYHTLGGYHRNYLTTIGVSLRITRALHFGASLTHDMTSLRLRYLRDTALDAGEASTEDPAAAERYDVRARSPYLATENFRVSIGTVVRLYPDVYLGLAYHTPPGFSVQTSLAGTMDIIRAPRDGGEVLRGDSTVYVQLPASIDGELRARLPRDLQLHVGGRWQDLSRLQAIDVRGVGSTFRPNNIPEWQLRARGYHDSFALWAGIDQVDTGQPLRFGGRFGFQTSAVDEDRTTPLTIAPLSLTLDAGTQWRISPAWVLQLTYGIQYYPTVSATRSDFDPRYRLDCIDSGFDYSTRACEATRNGYALPTAAGDYMKLEHAFRLAFRYTYQ